MASETQKTLNEENKRKLLTILEKLGIQEWQKRWVSHMAIPEPLDPYTDNKEQREKILRYLLLRVLINQQAKFGKVRELSKSLVEKFNKRLTVEPYTISEEELFKIFYTIAGEKGGDLYRVGFLGGIKPISLFAYRFKAYEGFIRWLVDTNKNLFDIIENTLKNKGARSLFDFLNHHPILESGWIGNDPKACRMYVNWSWFLFEEPWKIKTRVGVRDTLMLVDGHVGKIFCRAGLISPVLYEKDRPYIIQALKMRGEIENLVSQLNFAPFYVDNGAFYLFEDGFCLDIHPHCKDCPINQLCKKYIKWTGYEKQETTEVTHQMPFS